MAWKHPNEQLEMKIKLLLNNKVGIQKIAERFHISHRTVRMYKNRILPSSSNDNTGTSFPTPR